MPDHDQPTEPATDRVDFPTPGGGRVHISSQLLADIAEHHGITKEAAAEMIADALRVEAEPIAASWRDASLPPPTRAEHLADMTAMPTDDPNGLGPVTRSEAGGVFAVLRDIADAEPLVVVLGAARCTMCGARDPQPNGAGHPPHPHPHLVSCPWARAVQIVGRGVEETAGRDDHQLPDVEVSTDGGRSWGPVPLAELASLRFTCSDNRCHDDSRGSLYRAVDSNADPATPVLHQPVRKGRASG